METSGTQSSVPRASDRISYEMAAWRFLIDEHHDPKVGTYLDKEVLFAVHVRDTVGQGADDEADVPPLRS
ncbi:hypothetical protein [Haloarcula nitratireducens]|uniref:Uncharacterized protein n=1 Tax=Haloarcula nitratireducens TaxID=2487749 RepID=A0AAW4PLL0_9EURY|nr:hypothetical protein [Halomicroarcula nitratireducens]MBX0298271.1 hypothetical protein [Halomicroarcula nitratireducens]